MAETDLICRFCGEYPDDNSNKDFWGFINKKHKVAICTCCTNIFAEAEIFDDMVGKYTKGDFGYDKF